jgi:hypothetical protein
MANSQLYEKRWKYLSIGLMAILALGFSFPQAFAHVTTDMKHGLEHVIALLNGINTKVTDIQQKVTALSDGSGSGFKIEKTRWETGTVGHRELVTSDKDYLLHVCAETTGTGAGVSVLDPSDLFIFIHFSPAFENDDCATVGAKGGEVLEVSSGAGLDDRSLSVTVAVETSPTATVTFTPQ